MNRPLQYVAQSNTSNGSNRGVTVCEKRKQECDFTHWWYPDEIHFPFYLFLQKSSNQNLQYHAATYRRISLSPNLSSIVRRLGFQVPCHCFTIPTPHVIHRPPATTPTRPLEQILGDQYGGTRRVYQHHVNAYWIYISATAFGWRCRASALFNRELPRCFPR